MFKFLKSPKSYVLPAGLVMLLHFQNCAPPGSFDVAQTEEHFSLSPQGPLLHEDSNRTIPEVSLETRYEPVLVDRNYLKDLFMDVFGPSARTTGIGLTLFSDAAEFGSLCSVYEDYNVKNSANNPTRADGTKACSLTSVHHVQSQMLPKSTAKRQAIINRYCSDLVTNSTTFNYALKKISGNGNLQPTQENLLNLFHLFYRVHPEPHQGLIDSLRLMFSPQTPDKQEWKATILAVCTSSQWQVL